ncbi:MAG: DUF4234 domain-containing protein [Candidatus Micrarchaeia archaeon]
MAVKNRNPIFVIAVSIVTLGIYALYWFYMTRKELYELLKKDGNALIDLVLMFIPIINFYAIWKYCDDVSALSKGAQSNILLFVLALVFFPATQYLAQNEINKHATA